MTLRSLRLCVPATLLALTCANAQTPAATQPAAQQPSTLAATVDDAIVPPFKFSEMDIDSVLDRLEALTGRTIVRPANLPAASISLWMKRPLPKSEAVAAIETVLSLNGIGVAPLGEKFLKVVALTQIRAEAPELLQVPARSLPPSGRIAAKLFQPDYLRIEDFTQQAATLVSMNVTNSIVQFPKANAALVTDTISNLQRLETLLQTLDKAAPLPKFYTVKFAKASEMVQKLQGILQNPVLQAQLGATPTYTADDRTNQIILVADSQQHGFFDELITRLDVKSDPNTRTEVIYLKHATAKDVASLLTSIISGQNTASQRSGGSTQLLNNRSNPASNPQAAPVVSTSAAGTGGSSTFSSIITVIADERTNAVIANGTVDDLRLIKDLVDKVDIILPQVRIEVIIAEINLTNYEFSGIDALKLDIVENKLVGIAGSSAGLAMSKTLVTETETTTNLAGINRPASGGYTLTGLFTLASKPVASRGHILSSPTITTTHNKEAEIFVGESRPTISSYLNDSSSTSTSSGYRSTVSSQKIGISLKVTPLIGDDGSVQLQIEQTVDRVIDSVKVDGNEQPIVGNRNTKSFITAKSGEIIVLGGLQKTEETKSRNRLGPIPIIGDLLGARSSQKTRTDLVFFLRPVVLTGAEKDNEEARQIVEKMPKESQKELKGMLSPERAAGVEKTDEKSSDKPAKKRRK